MMLGTIRANWYKPLVSLLLTTMLAGCVTSGSTRLDDTGAQLTDSDITGVDKPETAAFYIQALQGGLVARIAGLKISTSDRSRALEAEYKALETAPGGQKVIWDGGSNTHGEVVAGTPYQVGSQNCRQYSHSISVNRAAPLTARGAACRNANGSWTPLS